MSIMMSLRYVVLLMTASCIALGVAQSSECDTCSAQIDQQIANLRHHPDVPINITFTKSTHTIYCEMTGFSRLTRTPGTSVCPSTVNGQTSFVVNVTMEKIILKCIVKTTLTNLPNTVKDLLSTVLGDNPNNCKYGTYLIDSVKSLFTAEYSADDINIKQCLATIKNLLPTAIDFFNRKTIDVAVVSEFSNFTMELTVTPDESPIDFSSFKVGKILHQNYNMWCEGSEYEDAVKNACACILSPKIQLPLDEARATFLMTCLPPRGSYGTAVKALTCM